MEADGEGPYLELKDLDSDNSLAENWTTGNDLTEIDKFIENQNITLYPNPTSGKIHIALSENAIHCQIIGLMGNVLQETSLSNSNFDLDLSGLPSGMYLVKVQFVDGRVAFRKIVKR
jgi:hypothetical protein